MQLLPLTWRLGLARNSCVIFCWCIYDRFWSVEHELWGSHLASDCHSHWRLASFVQYPSRGFIPSGRSRYCQYCPHSRFITQPDGLCISGISASDETDSTILKVIRDAVPETPVFTNTGVRLDTVEGQLNVADDAVTGTTFKCAGYIWNKINVRRAVDAWPDWSLVSVSPQTGWRLGIQALLHLGNACTFLILCHPFDTENEPDFLGDLALTTKGACCVSGSGAFAVATPAFQGGNSLYHPFLLVRFNFILAVLGRFSCFVTWLHNRYSGDKKTCGFPQVVKRILVGYYDYMVPLDL